MFKRKETRYFFFSGKGGVGKTSISAATALWLAKKRNKTLIISTDPAHSLSDSFDVTIGGEVKKIKKNLYAVEIDPKKAVEEYKGKLMPKIEDINYLKPLGLDEGFDIAGMTPGIDEIASFDKFLQYMDSKEYDAIVFDTAPTGHTLRFLSLPDVLDSWLGKVIKIRMKFSGIIDTIKNILPFGEEEERSKIDLEYLEVMKEKIQKAKRVLQDKERTSYNIVMIPETMCILESERSLEVLKGYGIPVKHIIVNQVLPKNPHCPFCREKRKIQEERIKEIKKKFKRMEIIVVNLFKEEVRGFDMLEKLAMEMYRSHNP